MILYWGSIYDQKKMNWVDEPTPLRKAYLNEFFKYIQNEDVSRAVGRCPAINDFTNNTFVITCPYDYELTWDGKLCMESSMYDQSVFNRAYVPRGPGFGSITFPMIYLFADQSVEMETYPAFYHVNDFTDKAMVINGVYNIGKHLRPLEVPFKFKRAGTIKFKRGDALFYIKLQTPQKIELQHFEVAKELLDLCNSVIDVRDYTTSTNPLSFFYNLAKSKNFPAKYLEIIKRNLL